MPYIKASAKTFPQLIEKAHFALVQRPIDVDEKAAKQLDPVSRRYSKELTLRHLLSKSTSQPIQQLSSYAMGTDDTGNPSGYSVP